MRTARFGGGGGGGGTVTSVFGRIGAVVATLGDYAASLISNDSGVTGATVKAALDTLNAKLPDGSAVGQALIWGGAAWAAGVDFGAQLLTTTGGFIGNAGSAFLRLGLASGSGAGVASASATGNIRGARGANGFTINVRNNADSADQPVLRVDTTAPSPFAIIGGFNPSDLSTTIASPSSSFVQLACGLVAVAQLSPSAFTTSVSIIQFNNQATAPFFIQALDSTPAVTGQKLTVRAQQCSGAGAIGGSFDTGPGAGTGGGGLGRLVIGQPIVQRFAWNDTGIGFYATAPVALQTVTGSRATGAALVDLLTKLANLGLIIDGTSA